MFVFCLLLLYNEAMNTQKINTTTFEKRKFYNDDDSGRVFLFALLVPILLSILFTLIQNAIAGAQNVEPETISDNIWFSFAYGITCSAAYVILYLVYNKCYRIEYNAIGMKVKMKWHTYAIVIAIGVISLFGIQYFIGVVDNLLKLIGFPLEEALPGSPETLTNPQSLGTFFLAIFATALLPAITEELLFRGIIFQGLRSRFGDISSIFISAAFFALMHQNLQQLVYPFILGSIMAWIVVRTGSLLSSMIVHFINNFLVILFSYLRNTTGFSIALPNAWWTYLVAFVLLAATAAIIYLIDRFYFKHQSATQAERTSQKTSKYIYIAVGVGVALYLFLTIFTFVSAMG